MANFKLIKNNIDVSVFQEEINKYFESGKSWSERRSKNIPVQRETKNIDLRNLVLYKPTNSLSQEELVSLASNSENHEINFHNYLYFQKTYEFLERLAEELGGQLARVMIVTLAPKAHVYPHRDEGSYYIGKNRYHIPIRTDGSVNICADEKQVYYEGELWWFDNKKPHSAYNPGNEERIHIIFDLIPKKRSVMRYIKDYLEKKIILMSNKRS